MASLYRWNFAPVLDNVDVLWSGAIGTLRLFAICVVLGMGFGLDPKASPPVMKEMLGKS